MHTSPRGALLASALAVCIASPPALCTVAALPPPCTESFDSEPIPLLVDQLKSARQSSYDSWAARCASEALTRKDESVVALLIPLLETDSVDASYVMSALTGPGHSGATAIPYLEHRLRAGGRDFSQEAYSVLGAMGKPAQPTIPLLIEKARGINISYTFESNDAINALGALAEFDKRRIVPLLVEFLNDPSRVSAAAKALASMGSKARSAQDPVARALSSAVASDDLSSAMELERTLVRIGDPKKTTAVLAPLLRQPRISFNTAYELTDLGPGARAAIPLLYERFHAPETDEQERFYDLRAMVAIAPDSRDVLRSILEQIAVHDFVFQLGADELLKVKPFPAELAPSLVWALEAGTQDQPELRQALQTVLRSTHTHIQPAYRETPPPRDVGNELIDGIWVLMRQQNPITVEDAREALRLDPNRYVMAVAGRTGTLRLKHEWPPSASADNVVRSVDSGPVDSGFNGASQTVRIVLGEGYCMTNSQLRLRFPPPPPDKVDPSIAGIAEVVVVGHRPRGMGESPQILELDRTADESKARSAYTTLNGTCARGVSIVKTFGAGYWSAVCPFEYDSQFIDTTVAPELRRQLGADVSRFNLAAPRINDSGYFQFVGYTELPPEPVPADWSARGRQISFNFDRCSRKPENVQVYVP